MVNDNNRVNKTKTATADDKKTGFAKIKSLTKKQKIIGGIGLGVVLILVISATIGSAVRNKTDDFMCNNINSLTEAKFFGCKEKIKELEDGEQAEEEKEQAEEEAKQLCESQTSSDGMRFSYSPYDGSCEKYETEKSCELKDLKLWGSSCISQAEYDTKEAEAAAERQAQSECSAKDYDWNYTYGRCNTDAEQAEKDGEDASSSSTPSASAMKERIITRCVYENAFLGAGAKPECESEFALLTTLEIEKVYGLIQSGTSYVDAINQSVSL